MFIHASIIKTGNVQTLYFIIYTTQISKEIMFAASNTTINELSEMTLR